MDPAATLYTTPAMAATFSAEAHTRAILAFEAALARAQARAGVIPGDAAEAIVAACRVELYDVAAFYREAARAGTVVIPLVRALTARVEGEARRYVHWGATSQDAIDTAMMLQARDGLDLLDGRLLALGDVSAELAERHRHTPMAGRTLMQQALPITFGLKAARWLALVTRRLEDLRRQRAALCVQFGGTVGTLAALEGAGLIVLDELAAELRLAAPDLPWHTERDRVAEPAAALALVAGGMAKIAGDVILLAQSEVGELAEGAAEGKGGSSAMPHKRNPVDATLALAAARLAQGALPVVLGAMAQEHERAAGAWQAEWAALPDLFRYTAGTVERVHAALAGLQVDAERMRANLDLTGGLMMAESLMVALSPALGRPEAFRLTQAAVERARRQAITLHEAASADELVRATLSPAEIARALDPTAYLGSADALIDRALAQYRAVPR